jgi:hypothetical protein
VIPYEKQLLQEKQYGQVGTGLYGQKDFQESCKAQSKDKSKERLCYQCVIKEKFSMGGLFTLPYGTLYRQV